jgi:hypothetical protein
MIPVVLLFTALGSSAAHANSILLCGGSTVCSSGGYVTEIEGLSINGTLYNVTFGTTDSNPSPFNTNGAAATAAAAIATALGTYGIVSSATFNTEAGVGEWYCVDEGSGLCDLYTTGYGKGPGWETGVVASSVAPLSYIGGTNPGNYFAEFSPSTTSTVVPEPGTSMLTLSGLGLLVAVRKRYAHRFRQAV